MKATCGRWWIPWQRISSGFDLNGARIMRRLETLVEMDQKMANDDDEASFLCFLATSDGPSI